MIRILLVDDSHDTWKDVQERLGRIGVECRVIQYSPRSDQYPFDCDFPDPKKLETFDYVLVDLELNQNRAHGIEYLPEDLGGGSVILPYLREKAPWIPAIAFSHLYPAMGLNFISVAGTFGFDGHIAKQGFFDGFSRKTYDLVVEQAVYHRLIAAMAAPSTDFGKDLHVNVGKACDTNLKRLSQGWKKAFSRAFWFAGKVTVEQMIQGHSGSYVLKVFSDLDRAHGIGEAQWIAKVNSSPLKLQQEIEAHQLVAKKGVKLAMMVPPLWPNVVFSEKIAIIGYQFAEEMKPASIYLQSEKGVQDLLQKLKPAISQFYRHRVQERQILSNLVGDWMGKKESLSTASKLLKGSDFGNILIKLVNDSPSKETAIECTQSMIHGDLHCDNVLVGKLVTFIDFAKARTGPIAYDVAKLMADMVTRAGRYRGSRFEGFKKAGPITRLSKKLREEFTLDNGQALLVELFFLLELSKALNYPEVETDTKKWIHESLTKIDVGHFNSKL